MKVVFLGATKGMGRALSRLMADRGDELFLLGRDSGDLERCARDLEVRGARVPVRVAGNEQERGAQLRGKMLLSQRFRRLERTIEIDSRVGKLLDGADAFLEQGDDTHQIGA